MSRAYVRTGYSRNVATSSPSIWMTLTSGGGGGAVFAAALLHAAPHSAPPTVRSKRTVFPFIFMTVVSRAVADPALSEEIPAAASTVLGPPAQVTLALR